jgi:hypothetical protein
MDSAMKQQTVRYCDETITVIGAAGTDVLINTRDGAIWVRGRDLSFTGDSLVCADLSLSEES